MAEYIEREAAIEAVRHAWAKGLEPSQYVEVISAADVAPVATARWEEWLPGMSVILTGEEMLYMCSNCTAKYEDVEGMRYCPNCGAKMDEVSE